MRQNCTRLRIFCGSAILVALVMAARVSAQNFTPTGSMATARHDFASALLSNGKVLVAGGAGTGHALPQGNSSGAQAGPSPVVRVTTRLVEISVIAQDKRGNLVTDLSEQDFRLFDNGQEQKVASFSMQSAQLLPEAQNASEAGPPNAWTNTPKSRSGIPVNLTAILYDGLNTKPTDQARARDQIIRLLSQIRPEDRVALYALGSELRVLHEFTSDSSVLLRILAKHPAYEGPEVNEPSVESSNLPVASKPLDIDANTSAAIDLFLSAPEELFRQVKTVDRILRTLDAMEAIAAHLAALPGRKSLLWVSGSFPLHLENVSLTPAGGRGTDQRTFADELGRAARALQDANVAVYPVDARGLNANSVTRFSLGEDNVPSLPPPFQAAPEAPSSLTPNADQLGTMMEIAARTGGVAYYFTNDIRGALREAMDDSRVVYTLAYMPAHDDWKGEFRKVKVEVARKDVHLRYRSGYFAIPDEPLDEAEQKRMLAEAQWSPLEATQLALTVEADRIDSGGKPAIRFKVTANAQDLRFQEKAGKHSADLVFTTAQKADDGHVVRGEQKKLGLDLPEERYREVVAGGMHLAGTLTLDPAATQVRFTLLDAGSGRLGSVDVPLARMNSKAAETAAPEAPGKPAGSPKP